MLNRSTAPLSKVSPIGTPEPYLVSLPQPAPKVLPNFMANSAIVTQSVNIVVEHIAPILRFYERNHF
jgi:hypothetical protein